METDKVWKIEIIEARRTKNSAVCDATYCGGKRGTFKFRGIVTLTPEGRKQFIEEADRRLEQHIKSLEGVEIDLVDALEREINGAPFAIDEINKKKAAEELKETERVAKIKEKVAKAEQKAIEEADKEDAKDNASDDADTDANVNDGKDYGDDDESPASEDSEPDNPFSDPSEDAGDSDPVSPAITEGAPKRGPGRPKK